MRLWMIHLALAAASPALAGQPAAPKAAPTQMSDGEMAQLQQNLDRGQLLWRYDQAAWHSTDALVADLTKAETNTVKGWVITPKGSDVKASYFGLDGATPYLIYSAVWNGKAIVARSKADPVRRETLVGEELRLARALLVARPVAEKFARCGQAPFNTVTLPGKTEADPVLVYFMTPQTQTDTYPLGGHYRVEVSNGVVAGDRAFTKSCIALSTAGDGKGKPAGLMVTHSLDTVPTEIHVFNLFAASLPIYVGVSDGRVYEIEIVGGQARARLIVRK